MAHGVCVLLCTHNTQTRTFALVAQRKKQPTSSASEIAHPADSGLTWLLLCTIVRNKTKDSLDESWRQMTTQTLSTHCLHGFGPLMIACVEYIQTTRTLMYIRHTHTQASTYTTRCQIKRVVCMWVSRLGISATAVCSRHLCT